MATRLITTTTLISLLVAAAAASSLDVSPSLHNNNNIKGGIFMAVHEMQRASYFSFVMLIKMVQDELPSNSTFLMPSDRELSKTNIPKNQVMEFLGRHSIPAPLLFDDLKHLPSGTQLPTFWSDYTITVISGGRRKFYLNNVQLVRPNLCTAGLSFRCHGINGVMREFISPDSAAPPIGPGAVPLPSPSAAAAEPSPLLPPPTLATPPSIVTAISPTPSLAPFDDGQSKSSSSMINFSMVHVAIIPLLVLSMVNKPF